MKLHEAIINLSFGAALAMIALPVWCDLDFINLYIFLAIDGLYKLWNSCRIFHDYHFSDSFNHCTCLRCGKQQRYNNFTMEYEDLK